MHVILKAPNIDLSYYLAYGLMRTSLIIQAHECYKELLQYAWIQRGQE